MHIGSVQQTHEGKGGTGVRVGFFRDSGQGYVIKTARNDNKKGRFDKISVISDGPRQAVSSCACGRSEAISS
jgi:hypothetical protein